jgi:branched-chain amino acid aminotransferase
LEKEKCCWCSKIDSQIKKVKKRKGTTMGKTMFYINGKFVDENQAYISVMDHGFLYGDGVFDAFRVYNGKIFQFDAHMNRLYDSARIIDLDIPLGKEQFKNIIMETVRRSGYKDCYIRPQVTRGIGSLGHDPGTCKESSIIVYVTPTPVLKKERSIRTIISSYRRPPAFILPPESKITHYMNNILGKMEARKRGADDAILLDMRGFVSEGCAWNIFLVKNKRVATPSITSSILRGITRDVVIQLLNEMNITVEERDVTVSELFTADEIFGTGTGSGISPVIEINGREVGDGRPGPTANETEIRLKELIEKTGAPVYE